ncbi:mCG145012 [Mus musculus]|nr:mCG145012 [Mus musculus]
MEASPLWMHHSLRATPRALPYWVFFAGFIMYSQKQNYNDLVTGVTAFSLRFLNENPSPPTPLGSAEQWGL